MTRCSQSTRHHLNQCWPKSQTHHCLSGVQWVNILVFITKSIPEPMRPRHQLDICKHISVTFYLRLTFPLQILILVENFEKSLPNPALKPSWSSPSLVSPLDLKKAQSQDLPSRHCWIDVETYSRNMWKMNVWVGDVHCQGMTLSLFSIRYILLCFVLFLFLEMFPCSMACRHWSKHEVIN